VRGGGHDERLATLVAHIGATGAETRRHIDIGAESLHADLDALLQRVVALNQKLDWSGDEMAEAFRRVDRRFDALEARVSALEHRERCRAHCFRHRQR
jgi:hypothetical protein